MFVPEMSVILIFELVVQVSFTTASGYSEGLMVSAARSLPDIERLLLRLTFPVCR